MKEIQLALCIYEFHICGYRGPAVGFEHPKSLILAQVLEPIPHEYGGMTVYCYLHFMDEKTEGQRS